MTRNGGHPRPRFELRAVPKPGGGQRWLADLDRPTDRRYRVAVAPVVARIERSLDPGVLANRVGPGGRLRPCCRARRAWWRALGRATTGPHTVITSDVAACYDSIGADAVGEALATIGAPEARTRAIHRQLMAVRREGLRGLPVGPDASAILANAVLAAGDRAVRHAGGGILRWVDDVAIIGPDRRTAVRAFDAWVVALRHAGLAPHDGKTHMLCSDDRLEVLPRTRLSSCGTNTRAMMPAP